MENPPLARKSIPYEITNRKFDNNLFVWLFVCVCVWLWLVECALFGLSHHAMSFDSMAFYIVNGTFHFYLPVCHMNFDTVRRKKTKKRKNFARKVLSLLGSYGRKFIRVVVAIVILNHLFYSHPNHISPVNA